MNREKNLAKNTIIITIGKVCTQMITFFLLPLYTGILSTEEYGTIDLLNTIVSLLLPIVTFQVEQALFRELIEVRENEQKKTNIISSGFFSVIIQCSVYLLIFAIIYPFITNRYKIFLATNVISYIFSSLFLQISRGLGENKKYSLASFISAFSTILFNILFLVVIKLNAYGMLLGTMLGQVTCILYLFVSLNLFKYISIKSFSKKIVTGLWKYSVPLIPNAISWWVFNASDRVIVSSILGLSYNGILSASTRFSSVYITLYNIFNISWTESISIHINDVDIREYFCRVFNIILKFFISIALMMIACMPFIYPLMVNIKFIDGYNLVPILILASLFNVVVGLISVIYVAKKNTKAIANTSIISAIINIVTHLILIKYIGLYAAVISTFISFFTMSIYRLYDIRKKYFRIEIRKSLVVLSIIILIPILFAFYIENIYLRICALLISVIYSVILNKEVIRKGIKILKNVVLNNRGSELK
ncbi:MAG: oligosaccharide flippase family protein [Bacilli bacterium]|nr:oligosaccharide flippase family protein [Bacilli bacterium]